jgi:sister chromatid cohesion protein PDS5
LVFIEFLKRFSDKSAEVRIAAIDAAKTCYVDALSGNEAQEILSKATCICCNAFYRPH